TTDPGRMIRIAPEKQAGYGEVATAALKVPVPEQVKLKEVSEFKIVGSSKKNVETCNILKGKSLFGIDYKTEGMLIAMVVHPPAFGLRLKSMDDSAAKSMPGIKSVFTIDSRSEEHTSELQS